MAKNLFNICNVTMPDDDEHEPFFDIKNMPKRMFTMRELSELAQYTELDLKHRWFIIGDVDVSGLITKNEKIDDSFFPYLIVHGDFKCSKYSQTFPRIIDGCFDCSDCGKDYINQGTFFPVLAKKVNCAYSVRDFDILMGILPNNIETLVVEPKLIKKSYLLKDEKHLKNVLPFIIVTNIILTYFL